MTADRIKPTKPPDSSGAPKPGPAVSHGRRSRADLAAAVLGGLLAAIAYIPSLYNPMVWDDELHVPLGRSGSAATAFSDAGGEYRRPLVLLSFGLQNRLGLGSPAALHAANAALHGANAALAVLVFTAFGLSSAIALAAALLFALHPIASGSVAYISGRTDLLATFFTLAAVVVAVGRRGTLGSVAASPTTTLRAAFVATAVVAAALSKESGLAAGPLVAAVWWWQRRSISEASARSPQGYGLLASPAISIGAALLLVPTAATVSVSLLLRLRGAGTALATFASLLVRPVNLHLDRLTATGGNGAALLGAALVAAVLASTAAFVRRPTTTTLALLALVVTYLPGSGLVPVYPAIAASFVFTGEQFLYLPLVPLAGLVVGAASRLVGGGRRARSGREPDGNSMRRADAIVLALSTAVAVSWTPSLLARQREFASAETVYRTTLAHSPSPRACFNLGATMLARRDYVEAATVYARCLTIAPGDGAAHGQLAIAWQGLGRSADARREYERSLALDAGNARVWSNFATLDANAGAYREARAKWEKALTLDPSEATAREALAKLSAAGR